MSEPVQIHIHLAPDHVVEAHSVEGKTKLRVLPKDHPDVTPGAPERMAAKDADCPHHGVSADTFRSSLLGEWSRLVNAPPTSGAGWSTFARYCGAPAWSAIRFASNWRSATGASTF